MANNMNKNGMNENNGVIEISSKKNPMSTVKMVAQMEKNGVSMEKVIVDNIPMGIVGFNTDTDKQKFVDTMTMIMENTDKTGYDLAYEIMNTMQTAAAMKEASVNAQKSEEDVIDGVSVIIDYSSKKIFAGNASNMSLVELANCDDMPSGVPEVAIKALLMERAKDAIHRMKAVEVTEPDYEDMEDEDDEYED